MDAKQLACVELSLSAEDGAAFAALSGDYNPLHLDPIASRRTPFGGTVVHGVHLFLRAVDEVAAIGALEGQEPEALSATFHQPVPTGVRFTVRASAANGKIQAAVDLGSAPAMTGTIELRRAWEDPYSPPDADFAPTQPRCMDFPPAAREGTVPLRLSRMRFRTLFPSLARHSSLAWVADVLATTQIVGMVSPGMNSIFSGFRLRRRGNLSPVSSSMAYEIDVIGQRSRMVRLRVQGNQFIGSLEAFFRPKPVSQRSMREIAPLLSRGVFTGDRVLIVGGSRGLGEVTAKIVAAGGAEVVLTYYHGKEDAEHVCTEIRSLGGTCTAYRLALPMFQVYPEWLTRTYFSHVYFFASPPIRKNSAGWDGALFDQFASVYVNSFATLVERVAAGGFGRGAAIRILYPSSIFVTQPEAGFMEYACAKAAGEAFCDQVQCRLAVQFSKPRLPRMRTDQTNGLAEEDAGDPVLVMLEVIRRFHDGSADRSLR